MVWVVSMSLIKESNEIDAEYWVWHLKEPRHDQGMLMYKERKKVKMKNMLISSFERVAHLKLNCLP